MRQKETFFHMKCRKLEIDDESVGICEMGYVLCEMEFVVNGFDIDLEWRGLRRFVF